MGDLDKKMRELASAMAANPPRNFDDEECEYDDCNELNEPLWLYWQSKL